MMRAQHVAMFSFLPLLLMIGGSPSSLENQHQQGQQLVVFANARREVLINMSIPQLTSEAVWQGGVEISFKEPHTSQKWKTGAGELDNFAKDVLNEVFVDSASQWGWDNNKDLILVNPKPTLSGPDNEYLTITLSQATGFLLPQDITVKASATAMRNYLTNEAVFSDVEMIIKANNGPGDVLFTVRGTNEDEVRRFGITMNFTIRYNRFKSSGLPAKPTSSSTLLDAYTWTSTLSTDASHFSLHLTPKNTFSISSPLTLTYAFDTETHTVLGKVNGLSLNPSSFRATIEPVDNKPITYCAFSKNEISEQELRSGPVTTYIILSPDNGKDDFITTGTTTTGAAISLVETWKNGIHVSPKTAVNFPTIVVVNDSAVSLTFTAKDPKTYNVDQEEQVTVIPDPRVLASEEAGCGSFYLKLVASPPLVTGLDLVNVTEVDLNEKVFVFNFSIAFDSFLPGAQGNATVNTTQVSNKGTEGDFYGFERFISQLTATVGDNGQWALMRIPVLSRLNLPEAYAQEISLSFTVSSIKSGLPPRMTNATFWITHVSPTVNATFDSLSEDSISCERLWDRGATVTLTLKGDVWKEGATSLWNFNHPIFKGLLSSIDYPTSFDSFHNPDTKKTVILYSNVSISTRQARIPMLPFVGIALPFDERVLIEEFAQMIEGRPQVPRTSFLIKSAELKTIRAVWGGAAAAMAISETKVRLGFWFSINLTYAVFDQAKLKSDLPQLFLADSPLTPYLNLASVAVMSDFAVNISFEPIAAFDISKKESVRVTIPKSWYGMGSVPPDPHYTIITIAANLSPDCTILVASLSESAVNSGTAFLMIDSSDRFVFSGRANATLNVSLNTSFASTQPLSVMYDSSPSNTTIRFRLIAEKGKYNIDSKDYAVLTLSRFFFGKGERCEALNFSISVEPGLAYATTPPNATETLLQTKSWEVQFVIDGEKLKNSSFVVGYSLETNPHLQKDTGFDALVASLPGGVITAKQSPTNSSLFTAKFPPHPAYEIAVQESVTFSIPGTLVESNKPPRVLNATMKINPVPSALKCSMNTNESIPEMEIVDGTKELSFTLLADIFNGAAALEVIATLTKFKTDTYPRSTGMLPLSAYSLANNNRTVIVRFPPSVGFDVQQSEELQFVFPKWVTISTLKPVPNTVTVYVKPGTPKVRVTGPALNAGSRDLVLGGLWLQLYLENDLFVDDQMVGDHLCVLTSCTSRKITPRTYILRFQSSPRALFPYNKTVDLGIPAKALMSNYQLPTIKIHVYVQPGVVSVGLVSTIATGTTEDNVRAGTFPALRMELQGDRFRDSAAAVGEGLAAGIQCSSSKPQPNGFCGRRHFVFVTEDVEPQDQHRAVLFKLQRDPDFDVSANEIVTIYLGPQATDSGLSPIPLNNAPFSFTVEVTKGSVFFRSSSTIVTEEALTGAPSAPLDVTLSFTLDGERWIENPTQALVSAFRSNGNREAQGFNMYRESLFNDATVNPDRRLLTITMRPSSKYHLRYGSETLIFDVAGAAVASAIPPTMLTLDNTIDVRRKGPSLSLASSSSYPADEVRDYGFTVVLHTSGEWEGSHIIAGDAIREAFRSDSAPIKEPSGFMALFDAMVPTASVTSLGRLSMLIRPSKDYRLDEPEVIHITPPTSWIRMDSGDGGVSFYPESVAVTITPLHRSLYTYVPLPFDKKKYIASLAVFVGVTTDMVVVQEQQAYGTSGLRANWAQIRVAFVSSKSTATRTPEEAVNFLLNSADRSLLQASTNISALCLVDAPLSAATIDEQIGIVAPKVPHPTNDNLEWIFISIGVLVLIVVIFAVYYHYYYKRTMYSGMNRPRLIEKKERTHKEGMGEDGDEELGDVTGGGGLLEIPFLSGLRSPTSPLPAEASTTNLSPGLKGSSAPGKSNRCRVTMNPMYPVDRKTVLQSSGPSPTRGSKAGATSTLMNVKDEYEDTEMPSLAAEGTGGALVDVHEELYVGQPASVRQEYVPPPPRPDRSDYFRESRDQDKQLEKLLDGAGGAPSTTVYPDEGGLGNQKFKVHRVTKEALKPDPDRDSLLYFGYASNS